MDEGDTQIVYGFGIQVQVAMDEVKAPLSDGKSPLKSVQLTLMPSL